MNEKKVGGTFVLVYKWKYDWMCATGVEAWLPQNRQKKISKDDFFFSIPDI